MGHGIHLCKPSKPTPISPCRDDLPASAIPSSVFYLPPSAQDTSPSLAPHDLLALTRSLLRLQSPTLLDIKARFWTWWRHRKCLGTPPKTDSHHLHILKKLISNPSSQILTVPRASWEWLHAPIPYRFFSLYFCAWPSRHRPPDAPLQITHTIWCPTSLSPLFPHTDPILRSPYPHLA